jgi:acetyl-CoA carboxylase carboxyl transferase subunit beta
LLEDLFSKVKSRVEASRQPEEASAIELPSNLMFKCPRCSKPEFMDRFEENGKVCPSCGYHSRIPAGERLSITADPGSFVEFDSGLSSLNPIGFPGYEDKLANLRQKTGLTEAVITGRCAIRKEPCVIGAMDSYFMMASMGSVVGEKITRAFEYATANRLPVVFFAASGGARMQEGIVSLMQMAKTSGAVSRHSDAGLLFISVMTDPTTGGVAASFSSLGDIILAEPKILIGFAGRRVIEDTIRQRLPDRFQSAEFFMEHGFVDMIVERKSMRATLGRLLRFHREEALG